LFKIIFGQWVKSLFVAVELLMAAPIINLELRQYGTLQQYAAVEGNQLDLKDKDEKLNDDATRVFQAVTVTHDILISQRTMPRGGPAVVLQACGGLSSREGEERDDDGREGKRCGSYVAVPRGGGATGTSMCCYAPGSGGSCLVALCWLFWCGGVGVGLTLSYVPQHSRSTPSPLYVFLF
jgi:hypothetical protein